MQNVCAQNAFSRYLSAHVAIEGSRRKRHTFEEIGAYPTIADAARQILKLEGSSGFALFFRVYVDTFGTLTNGDTSDAEFLSRLEYQSPTRFYLLTHSTN